MVDTKRNSAVEVLRLLLMLTIVVHHGIVHGMGLDALSKDSIDGVLVDSDSVLIYGFANSFIVFAVNTFLLISGYYGIHQTTKKTWNLIFSVLFYHLFFTIFFRLVIGASMKKIILSLFVFSCTPYWYVFFYLFLSLFTPLINHFFETSSIKQQRIFIGVLLLGSCYFGFVWGNKINIDGYTLFQFFLIYSIGRYIRLNDITIERYKSVLLYLLCSIVVALTFVLFYKLGLYKRAWSMMFYNNPFVIAASIAVFYLFSNLKFYSRFLNNIAISALSIYLFQNSALISEVYYSSIRNVCSSGGGILWSLIIDSIIIFVMAIIVDRIRLSAYTFMSNFVGKRVLK